MGLISVRDNKLIMQVAKGSLEEVKCMVQEGVGERAILGALIESSFKGYEDMVEYLIEYCKDVNGRISDDIINNVSVPVWLHLRSKKDKGALDCAVEEKNKKVIKILLDKGVYVDVELLGKVIEEGKDKEILGMLIDSAEKEVLETKRNFGNDILMKLSAMINEDKLVKKILDKDVNLYQRNVVGGTCLHMAALRGNDKVVEILMYYGMDVNVKDRRLYTPLMLGVENMHVSVVEKLLRKDKIMQNVSKEGKTAIEIAREVYDKIENEIEKLIMIKIIKMLEEGS